MLFNLFDRINDLYINDGFNVLLKLPVPPQNYVINSAQENIEANLYKYGKTIIYSRPSLKKITINSFFPSRNYVFRRDFENEYINRIIKYFHSTTATECVNIIENIKKKGEPVKIIITNTQIGTNSDFLCLIDNFTYITTPSGDINYTIVFIENKKLSV